MSFEKAQSWIRANKSALPLIIITALAGAFVVVMLSVSVVQSDGTPKESEEMPVAATTSAAVTVGTPEEFENLTLGAKSVMVWDVRDQRVIFEKESDTRLPLASITKVMTALVASEYLKPETSVAFTQNALQTEGENGFFVGEQASFDDLNAYMLVVSSNDAATAIAEAVESIEPSNDTFPELMNKKATELGLDSMRFFNPSGLDIDEVSQSGSYGSAEDVALLFDHTLRENPAVIEATREPHITIYSLGGAVHSDANTNILSSELPGLIGSKTGYTVLAGGNLAAAFDAGIAHPVVMVVLGSTVEGRFTDMEKLYNATKEYMTRSNTALAN